MIALIVASIIPLCFKENNSIFTLLDRITVSVFIIDYLLRWFTADLNDNKNGSRIKSFVTYPFTLYAIIDALSILPSFTPLSIGFKLFRITRLFKAFRALKILRYSKNFVLIINVIKKEKDALLTVCYLAAGYTLISALVMFQVEPDSFNTFFDALYWAMVTLTTVGYGDIYPISETGRIESMVSAFMGIAIVALPTGIITAGYMDSISKNRE